MIFFYRQFRVTREAKLGCVFTQTTVDVQGYPIRNPDSTTFVGSIERAEAFGWRIYGEAWRRGLVTYPTFMTQAPRDPKPAPILQYG